MYVGDGTEITIVDLVHANVDHVYCTLTYVAAAAATPGARQNVSHLGAWRHCWRASRLTAALPAIRPSVNDPDENLWALPPMVSPAPKRPSTVIIRLYPH